MSKLVIEIQDDGTLKINAQKMNGSEAEIMAELEALAAQVGGDLEVEKHIEGAHHHHHDHGHHHHKGGHSH